MRLTTDEFVEAVQRSLEDIPDALAGYVHNVVVEVEPLPDKATCRKAGVHSRTELLGLYRGIPLTERSIEHSDHLPDRITLFQQNIERRCRNDEELIHEIRRTVFHEVGHHFGLDEDDLAGLGYG